MQTSIPTDLRLTEKMVKQGSTRLREFCQQLWNEKHDEIGYLPPMAFLPDPNIKNILDNFARINKTQDLVPYIHGLSLLSGLESRLFAIVLELCILFATFPPPQRRKAATRKPEDVVSTASDPTLKSV